MLDTAVSDLRPRKYQEEIFERAQKENVIAALSTGSGKTLISLLLIKWMATLEDSKGKLMIFLVPKVVLVEQQAKYLSDNTPLRVLKLYGALDLDLSDRVRWTKRLRRYDVIVMTPQILVNLITHSLWTLERISLLVFDECHNTRKNHPYSIIMREYFQLKTSLRPKIFGMTASPIWNTKDPLGSLVLLEANLDSKIIGVRVHVSELEDYVSKPSEIIKRYARPPEKYAFPEPLLFDCLSIISQSTWDAIDLPWSNIVTRYQSTLDNLGPYCASLYLFLEVYHTVKRLAPELRSSDIQSDVIMIDELCPTSHTSRQIDPREMSLVQDFVSDFKLFFFDQQHPNTVPLLVPPEWCSPKLTALRDILLEFYTPEFQAIIFVEQRQIAACLSKVLSSMQELDGIRPAHLLGQGVNSDGVSKTTDTYHGDPTLAFRDKEVNVLIATSVAEEGLDFPACDLVVRFDPVRHMVGYVQSRGRARNAASRFVIMIEEKDDLELARYEFFRAQEPVVNKAYQTRHQLELQENREGGDDDDDENDEEVDDMDLSERERYVVPTTGAILSYDNAIGLLGYLCSLIPRDPYTPVHKPRFTGDFQATVKLPLSIPLLPEQLIYTGPQRRSKKEAKRAVAFLAVKRLHELDVFDDYLLPTPGTSFGNEETQIHLFPDARRNQIFLNAGVKTPWTIGEQLWLHPVYVNGVPVAGLVTGAPLPFVEFRSEFLVCLGQPQPLYPDEGQEEQQRESMHEYTRLGIFYRITGSPLTNNLGVFLVPLNEHSTVDFEAIKRVVDNPKGIYDWSGIEEEQYDQLLVLNCHQYGQVRLLQKIRHDLTPMSVPPEDSKEAAFPTFHEYWTNRWIRNKPQFQITKEGPLLEAVHLPKNMIKSYSLDLEQRVPLACPRLDLSPFVPMYSCGWVAMSPGICRAFEFLPILCHKITCVYRAQRARLHIGLPCISDDLLVEALTLPSVNADFSNQRLETLGDAVLELCITVHLMNKYPRRHEGQLTLLRRDFVANRYLVSLAREIGLHMFISSELQHLTKWPYVETSEFYLLETKDRRRINQQIPRRGLQDCMEALLGAAFVHGGILTALRTGAALGLPFGGLEPWGLRYPARRQESVPAPALLVGLQEDIGYTFHDPDFLLEAVTHPSFESSTTPSYQRLEFLGDTVIKMVVTQYLFFKFPKATSYQLSLPRMKAICASALASLAVRKLDLHKYLLHNSVDLNQAINIYVPILKATTADEIVRRGWRYDPPKALSDVFESVIGAVFVDSGYDFDRTSAVVEYLMEDVLEALSPSTPKDPFSELLEWLASKGCRHAQLKFPKTISERDGIQREAVSAVLHGTTVAGPIVSDSLSVAKFVTAERVLAALKDPDSGLSLERLCNCKDKMVADENAGREEVLNDNGGRDDILDESVDSQGKADMVVEWL